MSLFFKHSLFFDFARVISLLMIFSLITSPAYATEKELLGKEGVLAPDFSLKDQWGRSFKLSDFRGQKSVYLVFWNTWCGPCRKKVPTLIEAQKSLAEEIEILAINTTWDDSVEQIQEFQQSFQSNYAIAWDEDARVTNLYGVWGTPTEFIIDTDGVIRHRDDIPALKAAQLSDWNTSRCGQEGVSC